MQHTSSLCVVLTLNGFSRNVVDLFVFQAGLGTVGFDFAIACAEVTVVV